MGMPDPVDIVRQFETMVSDRSTLDQHLEQIAEVMLPRQKGFIGDQTKGAKKTEKVFDSRPSIALERFASIMDSMLTPRQQKWHGLTTSNPDLAKIHSVQQWFYKTNDLLFRARYTPKANFAGQNSERWVSTGAFGTGCLYIDFDPSTGFRYRCVNLKNVFLKENHQGLIDTVYRRFMFTARQAVQRWGTERMPERILKVLDNPSQQNREFEFIHVVMPRDDVDPNRLDAKGKPYASYYLSVEDKDYVTDEEGYDSLPYSISRYATAPDEVYGRGPAMTALADVRTLMEMNKTDLRAAHLAVSPPLLVAEDGVLGGGSRVRMKPGAMNPGGLSRDGKPLIQPMNTGARIDISDLKMEQRRQSIDDAFMVTLFQILVDNPRMTATEALIRAQEKGMLLAPTMGRQQSEALGPQIERELSLLAKHGHLDDMPPELIEAEGEYEITYESPMSRMQRAEELVGVQRTMELLAPFGQIDPSIYDIFDRDELSRLTAEVSGVPAIVLRDPEDVAAEREQRAQQEQMMNMVQAAQPVAGAMKDAAQANNLLQGGA